jgi:LTXXQ motif family protein
MLKIGIVPTLLALVLGCGLASSADARKVGARGSDGGGAFGAVVDQLVRGCGQRGTELVNWPFDDIARIADPNELQRRALEALRGAATEAAERLASDCPQQVPAAPSARLEAVEQGIDVALAAFAPLQPALQAFYGALDDEQKARLLRDLTMSAAPARLAERTRARAYQRSDERERRERRSPARAPAQTRDFAGGTQPNDRLDGASRMAAPKVGAGACEDFAAALRGWPIGEIERSVQLSEQQRVAFYEFVAASLKAADTLVTACPAATALTPARRMEVMLTRLAAVRAATAAIRPALTCFYEALDQGQKARFAGMS